MIHENASEKIVSEMAAILSRGDELNAWYTAAAWPLPEPITVPVNNKYIHHKASRA